MWGVEGGGKGEGGEKGGGGAVEGYIILTCQTHYHVVDVERNF